MIEFRIRVKDEAKAKILIAFLKTVDYIEMIEDTLANDTNESSTNDSSSGEASKNLSSPSTASAA